MASESEILHPVNITTKHQQFVVNKWMYIVFAVMRFLANAGIGIYIAIILYKECLHCPDCNTVVTTFLSLISIGCFVKMGLPLDKLANFKIS